MNLDEAIEAGFADIDGRLLTLPDIDTNGRAIVPYGVRTLGKGCINFYSKLEYLLLPDSLEELEEEAIHCIVHVKGVATYSHNDDPTNMEVADGLCDLRSIKRFAAFPLMGGTYNKGEQLFDEIIISSVAEIGDTKLGCDGPISVVGDEAANVSIDGVLYTDGGETLALFPPTHETVEKFVVPGAVKRIAPYAFTSATINTVVLTSNIEEVCPEAFKGFHGAENVIIPSGISFLYKTTPYRKWKMREGAFSGCFGIKSAKLGEGITAIAENMFERCCHLNAINFPESLSTVEEGAFVGCEELSLIVPETVRSIAPGAFLGTRSVILPSSCASAFEEHLAASKGTVVAVAGFDGAGCARAGYTPPESNLTRTIEAELSSGVAFDAIDARFHDGSIKKFDDKIKVAITRLVDSRRGHAISGAMKDEYAAFIEKNAKKAVKAFDKNGDIVCSRLLGELGYKPAELAQQAKKDAAKPRKPSVAQLTTAAIEAMRKGDASGLDALEPVAGKVNPIGAMRLLKYGAIKGDEEIIERLYAIFGKFEMPSIALCYAIAFGNDETARALMKHGVTLGAQMDPILLKGDTPSKQEKRQERYIFDVLSEDALDIPGRTGVNYRMNPDYVYQCTLSSKSDSLVSAYAEEGLLCSKDLKGLMLACLAESSGPYYMCGKPKPELASLLAKCGGLNEEPITLYVRRGLQNHRAYVRGIEDLLYPGCSSVVAEAVCSIAPKRISSLWDQRFLKHDPEAVKALVPHLSPKGFKNTSALLNLLARNGYDAEIKIVCKWDGATTEKMMQKAIESATSAGKTSTAALLMDLKESMFEGASANSLEL